MNVGQQIPATAPEVADIPWWKGAAIYQIYPRSFMDSNGDGIGDLPGITMRLDHVASLGVDAIWISPFFTSPMKDFGYDVADYCDVDPIFGTLADFDALITRAHALGLKVLIDQVYSHTSDEHAWFAESRSDRTNPKNDWYVWADAKPDGSPPSNWQSVFGGPAWTWDARRGQYYLHNFLSCQPQLNLHNPAVQDAVLGVMRFWLTRGIDGFRIDALNFAMHDPQLRDNPPAPPSDRPRTRPFDFQIKKYNQSHPRIPAFIERIRALTDSFGGAFTVAEVGGDEAEAEMKAFTQGETHLNSAYGFNFLYADRLTPQLVCAALGQWPDGPGVGWPSWAFENHDAPRAASRWWKATDRPAATRMKMLVLAALRGNIILYQGEELGLEQVDIPFDQLHDPEAIVNWPLTLSRDGARTPIPWIGGSEDLGFGSLAPWLPVGDANALRAVDGQERDPDSPLNHARRMLELRNRHPALRHGSVTACRAEGDLLILDRARDSERVRVIANLGKETIPLDQDQAAGELLAVVNGATAMRLPAFGALVIAR
ncbi:alpha-amylase family glycosyl hydrolase [Tsuneonella sp. YG55]|uniref:Alpha-amylase family glycosyl hydrolase n=1 Tax=Tsuneonella litorea TaxID=2976475 RepID=A0A9X3AJU7_9SPHN|nr:alpha-amylase family glycosyl hydrolase [Tsuneonella litorea]MCT2557494.1 alpha-amylase family glycosyl hydrolase [Tsuneonella litorea]